MATEWLTKKQKETAVREAAEARMAAALKLEKLHVVRQKRLDAVQRANRDVHANRMQIHAAINAAIATGHTTKSIAASMGISRARMHEQFRRVPHMIERGATLGFSTTGMAQEMGYETVRAMNEAAERQEAVTATRKAARASGGEDAA